MDRNFNNYTYSTQCKFLSSKTSVKCLFSVNLKLDHVRLHDVDLLWAVAAHPQVYEATQKINKM